MSVLNPTVGGMGQRSIPNLANRKLARELQRLRVRTGLSQAQAADALYTNDKKISRIETGQIPEYHLLTALLDTYGLTSDRWEPYIDLWYRSKEVGWWREFGEKNDGFASLEHDATRKFTFEPAIIPGLLQTEPYARMSFSRMSRVGRSGKWIDNQVAIRMRRQLRLVTAPRLELHVIMDEACLRQRLEPGLMAQQLRQIIGRSMLPNVTIRVVRTQELYPGMQGPFTVLEYADPQETGISYIEHPGGSILLEDAEEVRNYRLEFEHLGKIALSTGDSRAFIEEVIAGLGC
jgi:transcriptional regulator with XRE-family HTH domain